MALSKKVRVHGDRLYALSQKLMEYHVVSVSITGLLLISSLFERHSLCPISSLVPTQ